MPNMQEHFFILNKTDKKQIYNNIIKKKAIEQTYKKHSREFLNKKTEWYVEEWVLKLTKIKKENILGISLGKNKQ